MAAYTQQGAAVQTGGFGSVAPSVVNPNDAFDMLQKAFKTGLLQSAEINNALNVIPAQQRGQIAAANDAVAEAEMNARLRPQIEPLKVEEAKLRNKELSIRIDDPLGNKQATAQYFARELAKFGKEATGNFAKDGELLAKLEREQQDEKQRNTAMLAELGNIVDELRKDQVPFNIDLDAPLKDQLVAARKARYESFASTKRRKELEELGKEAGKVGLFDYPADITPEELRVLIQSRANEKAAQTGVKAPTEAQGKRAVYVEEINAVNQRLDELAKRGIIQQTVKGAVLTPAATSDFPLFSVPARFAMSADERLWLDSTEKWIEAVLRDRSGAAINRKEYGNARAQYFPGPEASPGEIKAKAALRQAALDALRGTLNAGGVGSFFTADGQAVSGELKSTGSPGSPGSPGSTTTPPESGAQTTPATAQPATEIPAPNVKRGSYQGRPIFYTEDAQGNQTITDAKGNPID